jgi:hypothetical protein
MTLQVDVDVGPALERITMVDDARPSSSPRSCIWSKEKMSPDWHACDPFGLGENTMLRRAISRELTNQPGLREVLEGLLGDSLDSRAADQQKWIAEVRALAVANVERRLTLNARDLPEFDALVELEMGCVEADLLGDCFPAQRFRRSVGRSKACPGVGLPNDRGTVPAGPRLAAGLFHRQVRQDQARAGHGVCRTRL